MFGRRQRTVGQDAGYLSVGCRFQDEQRSRLVDSVVKGYGGGGGGGGGGVAYRVSARPTTFVSRVNEQTYLNAAKLLAARRGVL